MPREARGERAESEKVGVSEALHKEQRGTPGKKISEAETEREHQGCGQVKQGVFLARSQEV